MIQAQQAHVALFDQQHPWRQVIAIVQRLARVEPQRLQHLLADAGERLPAIGFGLWLLAKHGKNLGLALAFGSRQLLF